MTGLNDYSLPRSLTCDCLLRKRRIGVPPYSIPAIASFRLWSVLKSLADASATGSVLGSERTILS